jgi:soluble lytic murein transglycosylase-like protein
MVNITEMLLLFQLQQANSAWQIGNLNKENRDDTIENQLFAEILLAAMLANDDQGSALPLDSAADDQAGMNTAGNNLLKPGGDQTLEGIIRAMGQKYGIDPNLIKEVVRAESGFNSQAVSPAGAEGLMQLMPATASYYGVQNPFDSIQNLDGGTHFLKDLLSRYQGNISLALAAYNAGPGAVDKHGGIPPYAETQAYVKKIMANLKGIDHKV